MPHIPRGRRDPLRPLGAREDPTVPPARWHRARPTGRRDLRRMDPAASQVVDGHAQSHGTQKEGVCASAVRYLPSVICCAQLPSASLRAVRGPATRFFPPCARRCAALLRSVQNRAGHELGADGLCCGCSGGAAHTAQAWLLFGIAGQIPWLTKGRVANAGFVIHPVARPNSGRGTVPSSRRGRSDEQSRYGRTKRRPPSYGWR